MTLAFSALAPVVARARAPDLAPPRPGALVRPGAAKRLRAAASRHRTPRCAASATPAAAIALSEAGAPSLYVHTNDSEGGGLIPKLILDARTAFKAVMALAWPDRPAIVRAIFFAALSSVCVLIAPMIFSRTLNSIVGGGAGLLTNAAMLLVIYFISAVMKYLETRCTKAAAFEVGASIRTRTFDRLIRAEMAALHLAGGVGSALSALQADCDVVEVASTERLTSVLTGALEAVVAFAALLFLCFPMALLCAITAPFALFFGARFGARAAVVARNRAFAQAQASYHATSHLTAFDTVKAYAAEPAAETKYGSSILDALSWGLNSARAQSAHEAWNRSLFTGSTVGILTIGGLLVGTGNLSVGAMLAFAAYTNVLNNSLQKSNKALTSLVRAAGPAQRLSLILSLPAEDAQPSAGAAPAVIPPGRASVEFRDVSFSYPGSNQLALERVSFTVPAGTSAAFVGRSGAGRTTICNLVARFHLADSGRVVIGGVDVREVTPALLRSEVLGVVSQDARMLPGTIFENIAMGRKGAQPGEVEEAAREAGVLDFSKDLTDGLDANADDLSAGQRQRVNVARCLLRNAAVVIADEPVASLDSISESFVNKSLDRFIQDDSTTVLLSSHKIYRARACHKIFVVDAGRIVDEGTHEELVARGGLYLELLHASDGPDLIPAPAAQAAQAAQVAQAAEAAQPVANSIPEPVAEPAVEQVVKQAE